MSDNDIIDFVATWNIKYPLDRWWRQKHNIAFGSKEHRKASPLFIRIEFEEDFLFKQKPKAKVQNYVRGNWIVEREEDEFDFEANFDNIKF